jgi:hypothetical protein
MFSCCRTIACLLLTSCVLSLTTEREASSPLVIDATTINANVCAGQRILFRFGGASPGIAFDGTRVVAPQVRLKTGLVQVDMSATWRLDLSEVEAQVDSSNVPPGVYAVEIAAADGSCTQLLTERVVVRARPVISEVIGATLCGAGPQSVTLKGLNLKDTTARLVGQTAALAATANASGTELSLSLPSGLTSPTPYQIVVAAGAECETTAPTEVIVAAPPEVATLRTGPSLLSMTNTLVPQATGAVPLGTRAELEISGINFTSGSRVFVGTAEASPVVASLDGTLLRTSIMGLPAGSHVVRVANGACEASLSVPVVVQTPSLTLARVTPNAVSTAGEKFLVDVFGDFSAAAQGLLFFIDTDVDPFSENLVPLRYDVRLDGAKKGARVQALSTLPSGGPFDVHVLSFGSNGAAVAGVLPGAVRGAAAAEIPRIVHKSDDWVAATGGAFTAYGCGFDGATFSLVPDAGGAEIPLPGASLNVASSWAAQRLRCRVATSVTQEASWSALTVPPGVYHLRATRTVAGVLLSHEDLYPLVVYRDAPEAQNAVSSATLVRARKASTGLVAIDPTGRKYVYFMGGSDSAQMGVSATSLFTADMNSFEFSALDRTHALVGLEPAPQPLGMWGLFFTRNSGGTREVLPHYGMSVVADGPIVYTAGGMLNRAASVVIDDGVYQSRVAHEEDGVPSLVSAPVVDAVGGLLPAGTHHYRIAAYYPAEDTLTGFVESIPSAPVTVTLPTPGRVRFSVTAKCGPTRAGYGGTPMIRVFRSDDARKIPDEETVYGFVTTLTPGASATPCVPGSTYLAADEGVDLTPSTTDQPIAPGLIYDFKRVANFPSPRAMTSLVITSNFGGRALVGLGGLSGQSIFDGSATRFDLSGAGLVGATGDVATTLAPSVLSPIFEAGGSLRMLLGLSAVTGRISTFMNTTVTTNEITGLRNEPYSELGFAFLRAGRRAFILGGVDNMGAIAASPFQNAQPRRQGFAFTLNDVAPAAVSTGSLTRRRAYPGYVFVPPYLYVAGGVVCNADASVPVANPASNASDCDTAGERTLSPSVEVLTIQ